MQNLALSALAGNYFRGDFSELFSVERIVEMRYSQSGGGTALKNKEMIHFVVKLDN